MYCHSGKLDYSNTIARYVHGTINRIILLVLSGTMLPPTSDAIDVGVRSICD